MLRTFLFLALAVFAAPALAQSCGSRLFVSGWFSTVHVFDACTGAYLRDLDTHARLQGAMAVRVGPDGLLYAVAEQSGVIRMYRNNDALDYVGDFTFVPGIGATGLRFDSAGIAYVAGYDSDDVKRFDRSGNALAPAFAPRASGLNGPDNGMAFGPDGNLYIPGWDSNNIVRYDPRTGETSVAVAARSAGLFHTRGILFAKDNENAFITSEGSGAILRWNLASGAVTVLRTGLNVPTGIDYADDGNLLVSHGDSVLKIDPASGATLKVLVPGGEGGITGQVFLAVIPKAGATTPDAAQIGTQFWVVGTASFTGRVLDIPQALSATGAAFGPALRFSDLAVKRWGSVRIELLSCTTARLVWTSSGADSAGFGDGGYDLTRYFENEATARCRTQGIDGADKSWVNGQWWGGSSRAGEGLFIDRQADGTTFVAWFTHRPASLAAPVDAAQVGTQYWIVATGSVAGRAIALDPALSATGTAFGAGLHFADLAVKRWGALRIDFTSCTQATFSWDSTGGTSASFGAGSYPAFRYFEDEGTARCRAGGLDGADKSWMNGQWWGRGDHAGEGWFIDRAADGTVFFAWFTHRPR